MRPPKSHKIIMEKLAFSAPLTIYRLNKETGYSTSTIHAALKKLSIERMVKKHQKGFTLSLAGLITYLISRFPDPKFGNEQIKKIVQTYSPIIDYPFLSLHRSFQKWLGNGFYEDLLSAAYIANQLLESTIHIVYIKAPKPIKRGEKVPLKLQPPTQEEEENKWKHTIAICFFNTLAAKPGQKTEPQDPRIQKFIKQTFEKEISEKKKDITKLKTTIHTLVKHNQNAPLQQTQQQKHIQNIFESK